jgi:hypothetical protein
MYNARKAVDRIAWELRMTNPSWNVGSTLYSTVINGAGNQIDFYLSTVDESGSITSLSTVRYYTGGPNNSQLLRRQGSATEVVANNIDTDIGQLPYFSFNTTEHTIINIRIPILKNNARFVLSSQANLRNRELELGEEVEIVEISEQ